MSMENAAVLMDSIIATKKLSLIKELIKKDCYFNEKQYSDIMIVIENEKDKELIKEVVNSNLTIGVKVVIKNLFDEINTKNKSSLNGLLEPIRTKTPSEYNSLYVMGRILGSYNYDELSTLISVNKDIEYNFKENTNFLFSNKNTTEVVQEFEKKLIELMKNNEDNLHYFNEKVSNKEKRTEEFNSYVINDTISIVNLIKLLKNEHKMKELPNLTTEKVNDLILTHIENTRYSLGGMIDFYELQKDSEGENLKEYTILKKVKDFFESFEMEFKTKQEVENKPKIEKTEKEFSIEVAIDFCLQEKAYLSTEEIDLLLLIKNKRLPEINELLNSMTQEEQKAVVYNNKSALEVVENTKNNFDEIVKKIKTSINMNKIRDLSINTGYTENLKNNLK